MSGSSRPLQSACYRGCFKGRMAWTAGFWNHMLPSAVLSVHVTNMPDKLMHAQTKNIAASYKHTASWIQNGSQVAQHELLCTCRHRSAWRFSLSPRHIDSREEGPKKLMRPSRGFGGGLRSAEISRWPAEEPAKECVVCSVSSSLPPQAPPDSDAAHIRLKGWLKPGAWYQSTDFCSLNPRCGACQRRPMLLMEAAMHVKSCSCCFDALKCLNQTLVELITF